MIAKTTDIKLRSVREDDRTADFVASTAAVDSYGEVVEQTWRLARFLDNPVVLWGHQSKDLPIGRCTHVGVANGALECTIKFHTADKNPKAEQVWRMVRDGDLKAVSVGFMPNVVRVEKRGDEDVYVLGDNELHEISVCNIPANPEALAKMKAKARDVSRGAKGNGTRPERSDEELGDLLASETVQLGDDDEVAIALAESYLGNGRITDDLIERCARLRTNASAGDDLADLADETMAAGGLDDAADLAELLDMEGEA